MWAEGLASTQWPPASISRRPGGCGSAGGGPRPKEGTHRDGVLFRTPPEMAHSGVLDARNAPPFSSLGAFSYRSIRIRPGKHSVWCQGVTGGRDSTVRFGSPSLRPSGYPVPSPPRVRRFSPPFSSQGSAPPKIHERFSPLRSAPSGGGGIMAIFRSHEDGRD